MSNAPQPRPGITPAKPASESAPIDPSSLVTLVAQLQSQVAELQAARARAHERMSIGEAMAIAEQRMEEHRQRFDVGKYRWRLQIKHFKNACEIKCNNNDQSLAVQEIERKLGTRFDPNRMRLELLGAAE